MGNVSALDTDVDFVQLLFRTFDQFEGYYNSQPTLVRGTDGSVGTTSYPYGQAFAEVAGINYLYAIPNPPCPINMGGTGWEGESVCQCVLNTWFPAAAPVPVYGVDSSGYSLDQTFYTPLASSVINQDKVSILDDKDPLSSPWDGEHFKSWLAGNEAFKSAFPNWEDCAFWNQGKQEGVPVVIPINTLLC